MQLRNKPASSKSWHNIQQPIKRWPPTANLTRCCSPTCSAPVKCVASSSQRNIAIVVSSDDNKAIPEPCCRGASLQEPALPVYCARYPNIYNPAPLYMEACCFPHHPSLNVPSIFDPPAKLKADPGAPYRPTAKKPLEMFPEERTPSYAFTGAKSSSNGCNCFSACHDSCYCRPQSQRRGGANAANSPPCEPYPDASNRTFPISTHHRASYGEQTYTPDPNQYVLHRPDATNSTITRDHCSTSSRFCPNRYGSCSTSSKPCPDSINDSYPSACGSCSLTEPSTLCVSTACELEVRSCRDACPSTDSLQSSYYSCPKSLPPSNLFIAPPPSFASAIDNTAIEVCNSPPSPRIKNLPAWINPCLAYCDPKCKANSPCVQCICIPCNCIVCDCSRCQICDVECKPCHPRQYSDDSNDPREERAERRDESTGPNVRRDEACGPCRPEATVDEACGTSPSERRDEACGETAAAAAPRRSYCSQTAALPDFGERFKSIAAPCLGDDSSESSRKIVLWDVSCDDDKPSYRESEMIRLRYSNFYNNYNVDEMALRRERDSIRLGNRDYVAPEPYKYIEVLNDEDPFYPADDDPPGYRKVLLKIPCQGDEKPIEMTIYMKMKKRSATFQRAYYPTCYILPVFEPTD
ncbi:unnamed protein product [Phyllotreta striolata]|uniref:Uncharacterized protein n=1 Tax=Phyllotreta striolata TaxID=444603 RepID=A0A9N9TUI3_PHYSR|nr:unnamed protein product [Phyllotreta striolata]